MASDALLAIRERRGGAQRAPITQIRNAVQPTGAGNQGRGIVQSAAQGVSFGLSDELTAGVVSLLSRLNPDERRSIAEVFNSELDAEREEMERNQEALGGVASFGAELAGGALTGGAIFKVLGRLGKLGQAGNTGKRAAAAAATEGGIAGFGVAEGNPLERLDNAAIGAGVGLGTFGLVDNLASRAGARSPESVANVPDVNNVDVAQRADALGIETTAGALSGDSTALGTQNKLQKSGVSGLFDRMISNNKKRVNELVLERFGREGSKVTSKEINSIKGEIGGAFDEAFDRMSAQIDVNNPRAIGFIEAAEQAIDSVDKTTRLENHINRVLDLFSSQNIDRKRFAQTFNHIREDGIRAMKNGEIVDAEALDDLEQALLAGIDVTNPGMRAGMKMLREAWRDIKVIDTPAVTKAATGQVDAVNLANLLNRSKFTRNELGEGVGNNIFELGRLVQQLGDATNDPGLVFGKVGGQFTGGEQGLSLGSLAALPVQLGLGVAQTRGGRGLDKSANAARLLAPRLAALQLGE